MRLTEGGRVRVFRDMEVLSREAASLFVETFRSAVASRKSFSAALSGGSTPRTMFGILAGAYRSMVEWDMVHFFWADERCVPPGHPESNYGTAWREMLSKLPVPISNIHRIKGELEPEEAAREYEAELRGFFKGAGPPVFDLMLLGIGEDGHTASLFPGTGALNERERLAVPVYVERLKSFRVTLTLPVINNASKVVFLASGRGKAGIISRVLTGGDERKQYPAGLVNPAKGGPIWLIDTEAAAGLKSG